MMAEEFTSDMVKELRENNFVIERNNVVVKLAKSYGFCWGVDRAVALAYEARKFYKDDKIHITNEIIHNPSVNSRLREMDINFVGVSKDGNKDFSGVNKGDVVILPAFGASLPEMQVLCESTPASPPPPSPTHPPTHPPTHHHHHHPHTRPAHHAPALRCPRTNTHSRAPRALKAAAALRRARACSARARRSG